MMLWTDLTIEQLLHRAWVRSELSKVVGDASAIIPGTNTRKYEHFMMYHRKMNKGDTRVKSVTSKSGVAYLTV